MDVWIETTRRCAWLTQAASRPTRACGLKPLGDVAWYRSERHAPHGRVDWNLQMRDFGSAPYRHAPHGRVDWNTSFVSVFTELCVTPHTGVWIETSVLLRAFLWRKVTPHTGVWIETPTILNHLTRYLSRPTRACGLKLWQVCFFASSPNSHAPHGRVDWNFTIVTENFVRRVTPHTGVWIETEKKHNKFEENWVTPHTGVWIETRGRRCWRTRRHCHAPHGACGLKRCVTKMLLTIVFVSL